MPAKRKTIEEIKAIQSKIKEMFEKERSYVIKKGKIKVATIRGDENLDPALRIKKLRRTMSKNGKYYGYCKAKNCDIALGPKISEEDALRVLAYDLEISIKELTHPFIIRKLFKNPDALLKM